MTRTKEEINTEYDKTVNAAYQANEELHRLENKLNCLAQEYYELLLEERKTSIKNLSERLKNVYMNDEDGKIFDVLLTQ